MGSHLTAVTDTADVDSDANDNDADNAGRHHSTITRATYRQLAAIKVGAWHVQYNSYPKPVCDTKVMCMQPKWVHVRVIKLNRLIK